MKTHKEDFVEIVPFDPEWSAMADAEIQKLRSVLPSSSVIDIQHVGSTAIPGMAAKPIIDIQIAVLSLEKIKKIAILTLKKLDYEYWYENPDPERMFFVRGMPPFGEKRTHHVHIVEQVSTHWIDKIVFRDYLIQHPEVADEYQKLKIFLAEQYIHDREKYTNGKSEFIKKVLSVSKKLND